MWFFRRLADAKCGRLKNHIMVLPQARCYGNDRGSRLLASKERPASTGAPASWCRRPVHGSEPERPTHDLFSQRGGVRFFLRCRAFILPLGTARDCFLVADPGRREAAAIVGATVA